LLTETLLQTHKQTNNTVTNTNREHS